MARLAPHRAVLIAVVAVIEATIYVGVRLVGLGGYRSGRELAVAVILVAGGGAALLSTRHIDDAADRAIWVTAAAVLAVTLGVQAASIAPPSKGRLTQQLDGLTLPFFVTRTTTTSGHSWCRPECPSVRRLYNAPPTGVNNATATALIELANDGVIAKTRPSQKVLESGTAHIRTNKVDVDLHISRRPAAPGKPIPPLNVEIRFAARHR